MDGKEKQEEKRPAFGSTLFTSVLIVLAAVLIFFVINSFRPLDRSKEFYGLISSSDGRLVVSRDANLKIDAILFNDYNQNEIPVSFIDNPGHKVNKFALRERDGVKEIDMIRTLSIDSIAHITLPEVPQEIEVRVSDRGGGGKIQLIIITDRPYHGARPPKRKDISSDQLRYKVQMGRKGLTGFVTVEAGGLYPTGPGSGIVGLGEGPIAALVAVRFRGNRPIGRSQLILIKRKGIVHPGDTWFDESRSGYFSLPYMGANLETSRLAFMTPIKGEPQKVVVCTLDFKQRYDVSFLFPEGPVTIDHWGEDEDEYNILYVREEFGEGDTHKVKVSMLDVVRFTGSLTTIPVKEKEEDEGEGKEEEIENKEAKEEKAAAKDRIEDPTTG